MKRVPLRQKRSTPRRNEGRVQHERIRPRATDGPTPEQLRFQASLRAGPCQCGCGRQAECFHHLLSPAPGKVGRRDEFYGVGLTHRCHNLGTKSVHLLGSEAAFQRETGVDLAAVAVENLRRWREAASDGR